MGEWIDTRDCVPLEDGFYLVQTVYGEVHGYIYTSAGGWNTYYTTEGELRDQNAINDGYVVRWFNAPKPKAVPRKWRKEYQMKGE